MDLQEYNEQAIMSGLNKAEPSNREIADALKLVISKLWGKEDMAAFVQAEHRKICAACPLAKKSNGGWLKSIGTVAGAGLAAAAGYFGKGITE